MGWEALTCLLRRTRLGLGLWDGRPSPAACVLPACLPLPCLPACSQGPAYERAQPCLLHS